MLTLHGEVTSPLREEGTNKRHFRIRLSQETSVKREEERRGCQESAVIDGLMYLKVPYRYNRYQCRFQRRDSSAPATSFDVVAGTKVEVEVSLARVYSSLSSGKLTPSWQCRMVIIG